MDSHWIFTIFILMIPPFLQAVLDDASKPNVLGAVLEELSDLSKAENEIDFAGQNELKFLSCRSSGLSASSFALVNQASSDRFLEYPQRLKGIQNYLILDLYPSGGGYHESKTGRSLRPMRIVVSLSAFAWIVELFFSHG